MPGKLLPMTLSGLHYPVIGCEVDGDIRAQRAAMQALLYSAGWPQPKKESNGRPRMGREFCSLSHGGGWALAVRHSGPIGADVEAASERLFNVVPRFCGELDQPVLDHFGSSLDTLCRLWTAKEAVFKAFGTGVDFLTGIEWTGVHDDGARIMATQQQRLLHIHWRSLGCTPGGLPVWMAVAFSADRP